MPFIFDLCGTPTNEGGDESFYERPTIPTGISNFDLRGALFFQAEDVLHVLDHLWGRHFGDGFDRSGNAQGGDAALVE